MGIPYRNPIGSYGNLTGFFGIPMAIITHGVAKTGEIPWGIFVKDGTYMCT